MTADPVASPDRTTTEVRYDEGTLLWVGLGLFVVSGLLGTLTLWGRHGVAAGGVRGPASVGGVVAVGVLTLGVTVVGHELLHVITARGLGYRVRVGVSRDHRGVYTVAPDQYWHRGPLAVTAVTPLLAIGAIAVAVIWVAPVAVAVPAVLALVTNAVGSAGDVVVLTRVLRAPAGTRFYDTADGPGYVLDSEE